MSFGIEKSQIANKVRVPVMSRLGAMENWTAMTALSKSLVVLEYSRHDSNVSSSIKAQLTNSCA